MSGAEISRRRMFALGGTAAAAFVARGPLLAQIGDLAHAIQSETGYGPLGAPDAMGVRLPPGFTATLVGRSGDPVGSTSYLWHGWPDGGACFRVADSTDHIYVSNSELGAGSGGASAVRFAADGELLDASSILSGTSNNCAGGATPWGTWLSCEEFAGGHVWECDPHGGPSTEIPTLGTFRHEAVAVDRYRKQIFLTEDQPDGRLYRFRPNVWPDLKTGVLEAAAVVESVLTWVAVSDDQPERSSATTAFHGGEGIVIDGDVMLFATKGDRRIWQVDLTTGDLSVFHDCLARPDTALTHVDNLALHPNTRHLFVAEDGGDMELVMLTRGGGEPVVTPVVRFEGHAGSEVTGPAFSPDGSALYLSSQRGTDGRGVTVRITGPFVRWISSIDGGARVGSHPRRLDSFEV